jgi:hypothetical protein
MFYRILADGILVIHLLFVLYVVFGGLLVIKWPHSAWFHLPCVAWGIVIELMGWICPLTPWENHLRRRAGQQGYEGGFIDHYVLSALYPEGLTRTHQILLGVVVLAVNVSVYAWLWRRWAKSQRQTN